MNFKQRKILKLLQLDPGLKFSELSKHFVEADKFPYHLKQLLNKKFISKQENLYYLTFKGYRLAVNKIKSNFESLEHKVPRVLFLCKNKEGKYLIKNYAVSSRRMRPKHGLPGMKLDFGKFSVLKKAEEKLYSHFGIKGKLTFRCTHPCLFLVKTRKVLFDFVYIIFDVAVSEYEQTKDSGLEWHTYEEIVNLHGISSVIKDFIIDDVRDLYYERIVRDDFFIN
jgi:hypothetical protein